MPDNRDRNHELDINTLKLCLFLPLVFALAFLVIAWKALPLGLTIPAICILVFTIGGFGIKAYER